jgi:hypothetical protein
MHEFMQFALVNPICGTIMFVAFLIAVIYCFIVMVTACANAENRTIDESLIERFKESAGQWKTQTTKTPVRSIGFAPASAAKEKGDGARQK